MKLLELVEQKSDVLILPTLPYGDCDWHLDWPGAVSIGSDLLEAVMRRICDCLYRWGCRLVRLQSYRCHSSQWSKTGNHKKEK